MRTHNIKSKLGLLALFLFCASSIFAYTVTIDDVHYDYISLGNYMIVTKKVDPETQTISPYVGSVTIPESVQYDGKTVPVKYIGSDAFKGCVSLTKVTMPNTILKINSGAFYGCNGLTSITIPSSVVEIGQEAFYRCTGLTNVYGLRTSAVKNIGINAFAQCSSLTALELPSGIETISNGAFENATSYLVKSVSLPTSLKRIGDRAFKGIGITSLYIPKNVISIGSRAFDTYACKELRVDAQNKVFDSRNNCNAIIDKWNSKLLFGCVNTVIPEDVSAIEAYAFCNIYELRSVVIPQSVTVLGESAFFGCPNLKSVEILGNVTEIPNSCFNQCGIEQLTLPASLRKICDSALCGLRVRSLVLPPNVYYIGESGITSISITSITFPSTLAYLGTNAIAISSGNVELIFEGDVPGYVADDAFQSSNLSQFTLKVKNEYKSNYTGAPWSLFGNKEIVQAIAPEPDGMEDVAEVNLVDGQVYMANGFRKASRLTYDRYFQNTLWQALYVPFSMSYDDWKDDYDVARLNAVRMYDTDNDGEYDETELEIIKVVKGSLYPNHPYFIKAKAEGQQTITLTDAIVYPAEANSIDCSTVETSFELTGTYSVVPGSEMVSNKYYALSRGQFCYTTNTDAYLNPNRWYMKISERGSQVFQNSIASARMRVSVKGEDNDDMIADYTPYSELFDAELTATAISSLSADADGDVYSIDGRLVSGDRSTLASGMYIQNNKKVFLK